MTNISFTVYNNLKITIIRKMQVQQTIIQKKSFFELIKQPEIREKIIKILIQTLYNLGFNKSAKQLQEQSSISYLNEAVISLKENLINNKFERAWKDIENIQIGQQQKNKGFKALSQLECLHCIQQNNIQKALKVLGQGYMDEQRANQLCQKLIFGQFEELKNNKVLKEQLIEAIIEKCTTNDIQPRSMQKIILLYIKLQKEGLVENLKDGYSLFSVVEGQKPPPMKICQIIKDQLEYELIFIKFNNLGDKFITVTFDKKQKYQLIIWSAPGLNTKLKRISSITKSFQNQIQHVFWNHNKQQTIGLATFNSIYFFKISLDQLSQVKRQQKILCCQFNPLSHLIYIGGYFNHISVVTYSGQQITRLLPFMKTRQLAFNSLGNKMYSVSATIPKIILTDLYTEKQETNFIPTSSIMSLKIQNNTKVLICTKQFIYVLSQNLIVLNTFVTPANTHNYLIESHMYDSWVVCMSQNFAAFSTSKIPQTKMQYQWPGSGVFAINGDIMIGGKNELVIWKGGLAQQGLILDQDDEIIVSDIDQEDEASQLELDGSEDVDIDLDQSQ